MQNSWKFRAKTIQMNCKWKLEFNCICTVLSSISVVKLFQILNIFSVSMREGERREMKGWLSNLTLLRCYSLLTYSPNIFCSLRNYVSLFNYLLILYITFIDCETHERAKYCEQMYWYAILDILLVWSVLLNCGAALKTCSYEWRYCIFLLAI